MLGERDVKQNGKTETEFVNRPLSLTERGTENWNWSGFHALINSPHFTFYYISTIQFSHSSPTQQRPVSWGNRDMGWLMLDFSFKFAQNSLQNLHLLESTQWLVYRWDKTLPSLLLSFMFWCMKCLLGRIPSLEKLGRICTFCGSVWRSLPLKQISTQNKG